MKRVKVFLKSKPIVLGFVLIILYILLAIITYPFAYLFPAKEPYIMYGETFAKVVIFVVLLLILRWFGWLKASGITRIGNKEIWLIVGLVLCYKVIVELYVFTGEISFSITDVTIAFSNLLYYLMGSLVEETMYRGLILTTMVLVWGNNKKGIVKAILISSALFGITHLLNIIADPVEEVIIQSIVVILPGIFYSVIVLLSKSLWPAIIIHWITNAAVNIQLADKISHTISTMDWIVYGILLLPLIIFSLLMILKSDFDIDFLEEPIRSKRI